MTMDPVDFLRLAAGKPIAVDTETTGLLIRDGRDYAQGVSVAFKVGDDSYMSHYFPFRHKIGDNYSREVLDQLRVVIESAPVIAFHNAKFDIVSLSTLGITVGPNWYCTMIMAHLINENYPRQKSLESCAKAYLGPEFGKDMSPELKSIIDSFGWAMVPVDMMRTYAEMDAELPLRLVDAMWEKFNQETVPSVWDWKRRFILTVIKMESRGILIDQEFCKAQLERAEQHMQDYIEHLDGYNPGSFKQMNQLLCVELGLPPIFKESVRKNKETGKKEKYQAQTFDRDAMKTYESLLSRMDSPTAQYILAYRGWSKAASAFYGAYLRFLSPDGRVRPEYHHHKDEEEGGTVTGRLSCSNPNLQQIPRAGDKPWNSNTKKSFKAQPGYTLWEVDFSQLELRVATAYSQEQSLIDVFNEERDIFTEMASVFQKSRDITKKFVYMTQYAAGILKIALDIGVSETVAKEMRDDYYENYPGFRRIDMAIRQRVKKFKKIRIWSGRYRHFRDPENENHKGMNSLIQGGSADIVERQMVRVFEEVDQKSNEEVRMLLTVHDSVWFEIKEGTEKRWLSEISYIMEDVGTLAADFGGIKFAVEAKQL